MGKYAIEASTLKGIANAIREKRKYDTKPINVNEMASEIRNIGTSLQSKRIFQNGRYYADAGYDGLRYVEVYVTNETGEGWLFQNKEITTTPRYDLAEPKKGVSYTLFVDYMEDGTMDNVGSSICDDFGNLYFDAFGGEFILFFEKNVGWYFSPHSTAKSAVVSIRETSAIGGSKEEQEKSISITENGQYDVTPDDGKVLSKVSVDVSVSPKLQSKSVTPGTIMRYIKPDVGYDGLSDVLVDGDANLVAENIAEGVSIFGVTGTHSGGGSTGGDIDKLINRSITEVNSGAGTVGDYAFYYCTKLKSANLPNATSLGQNSFNGCSMLESAKIPNAVSIGQSAFGGCSVLESVEFPNATSTGNSAFGSCYKLKSVSFPNLTSIGNTCFMNCYALTSVDLPKVTQIGSNAFTYCSALQSVTLRSGTVCTLASTSAFSGANNCYIYVPSHLVDSYKTATNWLTYASRIFAIDEGGGDAEEKWLFQNEYIDTNGRNDLPVPDDGVSFTCFVDGVEIATSTRDWYLDFATEDYRVYLRYDPDGMGWHFHPIDSQVQSGSVSIRING